MFAFLAVIYVIVCVFLILVVLLQAGKGGGMGAAFGGGAGGSQTVFGGAGAGNFLTRLTWASAVLFMVLSGTLAYMSSSSDKSLEEAARITHEREAARDVSHAPTKAPAAAGMSSGDGDAGNAAAPEAPATDEPAPAAPAPAPAE